MSCKVLEKSAVELSELSQVKWSFVALKAFLMVTNIIMINRPCWEQFHAGTELHLPLVTPRRRKCASTHRRDDDVRCVSPFAELQSKLAKLARLKLDGEIAKQVRGKRRSFNLGWTVPLRPFMVWKNAFFVCLLSSSVFMFLCMLQILALLSPTENTAPETPHRLSLS